MLQMLTLNEWAKRKFTSHPPGYHHLCTVAKNGLFHPPAVKIGRYWRIREDAEILPYRPRASSPSLNPKLRRILDDGITT